MMNTIEQFSVGGGHRDVGFSIGRRFGEKIHQLFDNYDLLQERLLPFHSSEVGRDFYPAFLQLHQSHYPHYVAELQGMAEGAERPFEELFLVNLRGEYAGLMALAEFTDGVECSDCLVLNPDVAFIGHNEDGTSAALSQMFVVHVEPDRSPDFTALCYPGFLPGNAFGFNEPGVMHTIDAVSPNQVRVGLGRHFIARSLFDADSLEAAVMRATIPGRAAGFTYNIGSLPERRIVCLEVAPDQHHKHEVQGFYVHTNHYLQLDDVEQTIGPSSRARYQRASALCERNLPTEPTQVLAVLGDEIDSEYPIFRTATASNGGATLCTALFDLDQRELRIYSGHPVRDSDRHLCLDMAR
jgi:hypothetical protein